MIDHLVSYPDEATALADPMLAPYRAGDGWRLSACLPGVTVTTPAGTTTVVDGETGEETTVPVVARLPGWRMIIATPERDASLVAPACTLVTDRGAAAAGAPFVLAAVLTPEEMAPLTIEPTFAGSAYPFGAPA